MSLDCADHVTLARFWAELLGGTVRWTRERASAVSVAGAEGGAGVMLVPQQVDGYTAPVWPGSPILHLDLTASDPESLDDLVARALALGASLAATQPDPRWRVLLDPAGHPFCITPFAP